MATQYAKKIKFQDRTNRVSNSMKPTYCLSGIEVKDSPRSEPRKQKAFIRDGHQLQTSDIEGAQAGYVTKHQLSLPLDQRREFRNTNYIADIQGSGADSVKHSIVTKREMHPLQPVYQSLDGGGEALEGPIQPLIPKDCVKFDASSFKTSGVIREMGVDGKLLHAQPSNTLSSNAQLDIITHRSVNTFGSRSKQHTPKQSPLGSARSSRGQMASHGNVSSNDPASNGGGGLMDTGESFSGMGSGNANSMNFFDTSNFGESKSYAEKFSDSDFIVPKLETSGSRGGGGGYESKLSTGRASGHASQASSRKSSRGSVISRRAQAELEAEVNAIRGL